MSEELLGLILEELREIRVALNRRFGGGSKSKYPNPKCTVEQDAAGQWVVVEADEDARWKSCKDCGIEIQWLEDQFGKVLPYGRDNRWHNCPNWKRNRDRKPSRNQDLPAF